MKIGEIYKQLEELGNSSDETIFGTNLIIEYIKQETNLPDDKANKVYNYCWEQGHAYGLHDVFGYAIELCDLLVEVLK